MCTIIKDIKSNIKILNYDDNPKINVIKIILPNKNNINIIQENILLAGTKQRIAKLFIENLKKEGYEFNSKKIHNKSIHTLVYSGTYNGYGAIATAYAAYRLDLKSIVFLDSKATGSLESSSQQIIISSKQIKILLALKAKIYICSNYRKARDLLYKTVQNKDWSIKPGYYIVPMGFNDENGVMINILAKQIKKAFVYDNINSQSKIRIWLVVGSGGILSALIKSLPNAKFYVLLTGGGKYLKRVQEMIKLYKNIIVINNYKIDDEYNDYDKYYKSVKGYDSQIFPYVKKYSKDSDFIWNVSSD